MSSSLSRQLFSPALRLALLVAGAAPMAQAQRVARPDAAKSSGVAVWLTTADKAVLFQPQAGQLKLGAGTNAHPTIEIDEARTYQTIDGFGYCLTGGSARLLHQMAPAERARLLRELFGTDGRSIGVSYLRVSIGASDLDDRVFSYDACPPGKPTRRWPILASRPTSRTYYQC